MAEATPPELMVALAPPLSTALTVIPAELTAKKPPLRTVVLLARAIDKVLLVTEPRRVCRPPLLTIGSNA